MPMIDIYATAGTFSNPHALAKDAAATVTSIEQVPDIPMFRKNTAAFVHELKSSALSNVDGDTNDVRVQVLTNQGALDRPKQIAGGAHWTDLIVEAAGDDSLKQRTWVLLTEAVEGGCGFWGHAHKNDEIVTAAQSEIASLKG